MKRGFEIVSAYADKDINLPQRKTKDSAGYDFEAAEDVLIPSGELGTVLTGIKAYMQSDEYLGVHIRSGLARSAKLILVNSQGIIDADYYNNPANEGHIMFLFYNLSSSPVLIQKGQRVAQGNIL